MTAIEKDLFNDDDVLAVFYGGSIGSENMDLYSDIDLCIVVLPEKFQEFISNTSVDYPKLDIRLP
jgi:predicted nucleotidyltransferase